MPFNKHRMPAIKGRPPMNKMIFVNLPVRDLPTATAEAAGKAGSDVDGPEPSADMTDMGGITAARRRISSYAAALAALAVLAGPAWADEGMPPMAGHMIMTTLRPLKDGDRRKADALVASARTAMAPYEDYHKALADGFEIFLPNIPQPQYHFTNYRNGLDARSHFDPLKPTSLLYSKTADGGFKLVGVMYTARVDATEADIDERVPLSIARWHQHINFCKAPADQKAAYFGPDAKFGLRGSITTRQACESAGGEFHPHLFGWMVHVYPNEKDTNKIWSTDDDDQGHDNMDHSAMPGMK